MTYHPQPVSGSSQDPAANAPQVRPAEIILSGATIGIVGGGQLGRMFAMAAARMGYEVVVFCQREDEPAAQVAHRCVLGALDDAESIDRFAQQCDVITLEFENIPSETIARCGQSAPTYPAASVLAIAQDRLLEKTTLRDAGLPVTPFAEVRDVDSLCAFADEQQWPLVVKKTRSGYDGKGQSRVENADDAKQVSWHEADSWIAEQCIAFDCEVSVVVARRADGCCSTFPLFENDHQNHILDVTTVPASVSEAVQERAKQIAITAAEVMGLVGLLCVEMFVQDEELMINEVAPRPHNSGHLTIEACHTSQFEQHIRAICTLPLGNTDLVAPAAAMTNLLGDLWSAKSQGPDWASALTVPGVRLHLYGKRHAKPGRKMGHLTALGSSPTEAAQLVRESRRRCAN